MRVDTTGWQAATPRKRRPGGNWAAVLGALVVAFVFLAGYDVFTSTGVLNARPVAATSPSPSAHPRQTGSGRPSPTPSPSTTPARPLTALSVAAFGPEGTLDGDAPDNASRVLASDDELGWTSSWYTTPHFGNLKAGLGLLFDMGHQVSISSVRLKLGAALGANVEVRLGDTPDMAGLSTAAKKTDVGGSVHLSLTAPVVARYVLVWFTMLPPDSAGTYQVTVYRVTMDGQP